VYEPLSTFDGPLANLLQEAVETGHLEYSTAGDRERTLWLRSQLATPPMLLPGELPTGQAAPSVLRDVLVLDPAEVPAEQGSVGPGPLVCPLDLRARSAAALVGFISSASPTLRTAALHASLDAVREKASAVLSDLPSGAVHVVSTTWTVPLPWFALVDPAHRHVVVATQDDPRRQVCWRIAMTDARRRVARAHDLAVRTFGDAGPTKVLQDTGRWLEHFHEASAVELDYGGLVQLLDDQELLEDSSAEDVNAIIEALDAQNVEEVATRFERLRDFWSELAMRERLN
jgi:hypothetical protein